MNKNLIIALIFCLTLLVGFTYAPVSNYDNLDKTKVDWVSAPIGKKIKLVYSFRKYLVITAVTRYEIEKIIFENEPLTHTNTFMNIYFMGINLITIKQRSINALDDYTPIISTGCKWPREGTDTICGSNQFLGGGLALAKGFDLNEEDNVPLPNLQQEAMQQNSGVRQIDIRTKYPEFDVTKDRLLDLAAFMLLAYFVPISELGSGKPYYACLGEDMVQIKMSMTVNETQVLLTLIYDPTAPQTLKDTLPTDFLYDNELKMLTRFFFNHPKAGEFVMNLRFDESEF